MANHRMFSNRIANSAKFLQMPAETQALYFHLVLRADDDGVVESYPLMKMLNSTPDSFKILIAKVYIKQLNEDQVVVILDWLEHNKIRSDRKVNSIYTPLLKEKAPEIKIIEPKPRSDVEDNSQRLGGQSTDGISQVKLSQVSIPEQSSELKKKSNNKDMNLYSELNSSDSYDREIDADTGEEITPVKKTKATDKFWELVNWSTQRRGAPFLKQSIKKQFKAFAIAKDNKINPTDLKDRWIEMEDDKFWKNAGFDWMDVINSFSKKPVK